MSCRNQSHLPRSNSPLGTVYTLDPVIPDVKARHFCALDDIHPKVARCLRIAPGHPVMLGNATTRLVGGTMDRVAHIRTDIDDGHQLFHFLRGEPLTVDAV